MMDELSIPAILIQMSHHDIGHDLIVPTERDLNWIKLTHIYAYFNPQFIGKIA